MLDFNPLPRKEGDSGSGKVDDDESISIHSLVKRETLILDSFDNFTMISIHSLVKRETARRKNSCFVVSFQSTPS